MSDTATRALDAASPTTVILVRHAEKIRTEHPGEVVVVVGHSNTTPAVLRALGVAAGSDLADSARRARRLHGAGA